MKLRTKRGYTVLVLEEQSGATHYLNPEDDNFVNSAQVQLPVAGGIDRQ